VDYRTNTPESGSKLFYVPPLLDEGGVGALLPGNIMVDISSTGQATIPDSEVNFTGLSITSYNFNVNFNRQVLAGLGHKLPIDRKITPPIFADLNFEIIVGEHQTGVLNELTRKDLEYNITLKLKHPDRFGAGVGPTGFYNAGILNKLQDVAAQYDFLKSKFQSRSSNMSVGNHKVVSLAYSTEIDPYDVSKGWFISGVIPVDKIEDFLLNEDGTYLLNEDGFPIVKNYIPLF